MSQNYYIVFGISVFTILFIFIAYFNKINMNDTYKKIIIILLFTFYFLGTAIMISLNNDNEIYNYIVKDGHYEMLLPLLIITGILGYFVISALLGKIDINIDRDNFISGDKISGTIKLKLNKRIKSGDLYVYLRGYRSSYNSDGGKNWIKKYENSKHLGKYSEEDFKFNLTKEYNFEFIVPYNNDNEYGNILNQEGIKEIIGAASFITGGKVNINNLTDNSSITLWKIEAELKKTGIDIKNKRTIYISMKPKED